jgi:protease-4
VSALSNLLVNLWRLIGNARSRLLGRPPGFVWIELSGALPEFEMPAGFFRRRINRGPGPVTLQTLRERLGRISSDGRVRGVVLRIKDVTAGWAALEEARGELLAFREGGGRVVAYLTDPVDTRSYYLACAADEVLVAPLVTVGVTGVRTRVSFFKDALDSLGIGAEVVAVSPYKSAGEPFTRNDFSREAREQAQRLLDGRYEELVRAIGESRGLTGAEARDAIDGAPYGPEEAVDARIVDGVLYEDELPERLAAGGQRPRIAEWDAAKKSLKRPYRRRARRVGLVQVKGAITRGRSRRVPVPLPFLGGERAGSETVVAALRGAERNRRVDAVLLHVESPGGDALASDLIWREVRRISAKKPVVVLMGNVAASGGYYVSAPAAHVVARRSTVTGSIGVITIRPMADRLYERVGVNPVGLERGERAGLMDLSRPPTDDELRVLEHQIELVYDEFKDRVSRGRNLPDLDAIAGGRVWSGAEARGLGLVDGVGGFWEAFRKACELGGVGEGIPSDVLLKMPVPRAGRPAPGEPAEVVEEIVDGVRRELLELSGRVWAMGPYTLSDDW